MSSDSRTRRQFTGAEKMAILREHLIEKVAISQICDKHRIQPTLFYLWQKKLFEDGAAVFEQRANSPRQQSAEARRLEALEAKLSQKNEVLAELMGEHVALKKSWPALTDQWTPHEIRDQVIDFVNLWTKKTEIPASRFIGWLGISSSKYYDWTKRYGKVNEHNALIPRDHWLLHWEKQAILDFEAKHPLEGYRRLTYMMIDAAIVAASAATVYRVLKTAGRIQRWNRKPSRKGTGFVQPLAPHEHWHVDISYINIGGTFYYLCSILDGCSRFIVHWDIRPHMTEADVQIILQAAREKFPDARSRIISDNGPQFIAKDFKEFIRICGMTHVRTSPYYPQANGKLERYHKSIKSEAIRPGTPLCLEDARKLVHDYVEHYNHVRLHSAIGYITPADRLAG